jgi:WD40 repeat protein
VSLNGTEVSVLNLDEWTVAGKRPDGSRHEVITGLSIAELPRLGYLGFQSLRKDCWFKDIRVSTSAPASPASLVLPSYRVTGQFSGHQSGPLEAVLITHNGRYALSCGQDGKARLWEIQTRRERHAFSHQGMVWSAAIAPDGQHLLTAGHDQTVGYWELDTGRRIFQYPAHANHVKAVAFFPDSRYALSAGDDGIVILWDLPQHQPIRAIGRHNAEIQCLAISPDGSLALTGGDDRLVRVWDFPSGQELPALGGHQGAITCVAIAADGRKALTAGADKDLIVWDLQTRREIARAALPGGEIIMSATFLEGGRRIVAGGHQGTLALWDRDSGSLIRQGQGTSGHLGLAARPDGRLVLTADRDGVVRIWSPAPLRLPRASGRM